MASNKPVGCLFPMCACAKSTLGCAYEPYDLKEPHNQEEEKEGHSFLATTFAYLLSEE